MSASAASALAKLGSFFSSSGMEAKILEQHDAALAGLRDGLARRLADAIGGELDGAPEQLGELHGDRLQREFGAWLALRPAQMRREDDR